MQYTILFSSNPNLEQLIQYAKYTGGTFIVVDARITEWQPLPKNDSPVTIEKTYSLCDCLFDMKTKDEKIYVIWATLQDVCLHPFCKQIVFFDKSDTTFIETTNLLSSFTKKINSKARIYERNSLHIVLVLYIDLCNRLYSDDNPYQVGQIVHNFDTHFYHEDECVCTNVGPIFSASEDSGGVMTIVQNHTSHRNDEACDVTHTVFISFEWRFTKGLLASGYYHSVLIRRYMVQMPLDNWVSADVEDDKKLFENLNFTKYQHLENESGGLLSKFNVHFVDRIQHLTGNSLSIDVLNRYNRLLLSSDDMNTRPLTQVEEAIKIVLTHGYYDDNKKNILTHSGLHTMTTTLVDDIVFGIPKSLIMSEFFQYGVRDARKFIYEIVEVAKKASKNEMIIVENSFSNIDKISFVKRPDNSLHLTISCEHITPYPIPRFISYFIFILHHVSKMLKCDFCIFTLQCERMGIIMSDVPEICQKYEQNEISCIETFDNLLTYLR